MAKKHDSDQQSDNSREQEMLEFLKAVPKERQAGFLKDEISRIIELSSCHAQTKQGENDGSISLIPEDTDGEFRDIAD